MRGYDLSRARLRSRWRKLRHDPAAFVADLPWPPLRTAGLAALLAATWMTGWAAAGRSRAGLQGDDDGVHRWMDGAPPPMLKVEPIGRLAVVSAFAAGGRLLGGSLLQPDQPAFLPAGPELASLRCRLVRDSGAVPVLNVGAATRLQVLRKARAAGADLATAVRAAWPAGRNRRTGEVSPGTYARWIRRNEHPRQAESERARPSISILMPVHDPEPRHLRAALQSVVDQSVGGWTLCIADDGSASAEVREILAQAVARDDRLRLVRLEPGKGVAAATNAALSLAEGEVCLFLDHDDRLARDAVARIGEAFAAEPQLVAVYSDEDTIDAEGRRSAPLFKPELDRERLLRQNYVNHAFAIRTALLRSFGGLRPGIEGAQDHDLVLRAAEAGPIRRLPHVLYHWRSFPGGRSLSQRAPARMARARLAAVRDGLERLGRAGEPVMGPDGLVDLHLPFDGPPPRVAIIVPTRNGGALLEACAAGVLRGTDYPDLELRLVDNGSDDPDTLQILRRLSADPRVQVRRIEQPFNFSVLNNAAAADATAEVLLFLNDDVLVAEPSWLKRMVALAVTDGIGAVGARLLYPDGRLQHGGLVLGLGPQGVAGHEFRGAPGDMAGPQARLGVTREASAVTAACMAVKRSSFEQVGGFDPELAVAFNDVDLCLKLRAGGLRNLWIPAAQLVHVESASRGAELSPEKAARFAGEVRLMHERWGAALAGDPYYNPNLTLEDESFSPAAVSRAPAI